MKHRRPTQHIRRYRTGRWTCVNRGVKYQQLSSLSDARLKESHHLRNEYLRLYFEDRDAKKKLDTLLTIANLEHMVTKEKEINILKQKIIQCNIELDILSKRFADIIEQEEAYAKGADDFNLLIMRTLRRNILDTISNFGRP